MGYRGSKSIVVPRLVNTAIAKEQRVNGNYCGLFQLRCTLVHCESSNPVKFLSNQINKAVRLYSTTALAAIRQNDLQLVRYARVR